MHAVVEAPTYLADAKAAGVSDDERSDIVAVLAADPQAGDVMVGTGGARKLRIAGRGKGKSGGYRVVTYFAAADVPVFLLALVDKGERENLSKAERNELRTILAGLADDYREGVRRKAAALKGRTR